MRPHSPRPYFDWTDDDCAGIKCGCGEELLISTSHPTRCPKCQRIFQLYQVNAIQERSPDSVNICPHCGGVRYDDGRYCPPCQRFSDGKTIADHAKELDQYLAEQEGMDHD